MNYSEISNPGPGEEPVLGGSDPQDHLLKPFASDQFDQSRSEFPVDPEASADWAFSLPVSESDQLDGRPGEKWLRGPKEHKFIDLNVFGCVYIQFSSSSEC